MRNNSIYYLFLPPLSIHKIIHIRNQDSVSINITATTGVSIYPCQGGGGQFTPTWAMPPNTGQTLYCDGTSWQGFN